MRDVEKQGGLAHAARAEDRDALPLPNQFEQVGKLTPTPEEIRWVMDWGSMEKGVEFNHAPFPCVQEMNSKKDLIPV